MKNDQEMDKKLDLNELEQANGGLAVHSAAKKKRIGKLIDWIWSWFE